MDNLGAYSALVRGECAVVAPAVRLDDYLACEMVSRIDLIKIDIEGAEPMALEGAVQTLARFHPVVLMEVRQDMLARTGRTTRHLWNTMEGLGYRAFLVGHSSDTSRPLPDLDPVRVGNVLFYAGDLPAALTQRWNYRDALRWAHSAW